jgi:hypothetical protein
MSQIVYGWPLCGKIFSQSSSIPIQIFKVFFLFSITLLGKSNILMLAYQKLQNALHAANNNFIGFFI